MELEKILEEIDNLYVDETDFGIECNMENRSDVACDNCYECIKEACKSIIRKHMNDGWIPVEERLPEGRTRVICQFDNGDIELLWQDWESDTESLTYWTDFDFMAEKKVIAWRPLPDPYRPEVTKP